MDFMRFVAAHGEWKLTLKRALEAQHPHVSSEHVRHDDRCEFGKFYYQLPDADRCSECGLEVREKHAEFHVEAARVLELMEQQRWQEAYDAISPGSDFERLSRELTRLMFSWNQELSAKP
ncbi:MAG: CZB domain-containing protein [Planctomycetes bacterium]|nr:CZB domain-containing protein [Planctomycetota bacterium]